MFVAVVNVCSLGERREKELFFIELYDFFKKKNSFRVVSEIGRASCRERVSPYV